MEWNKMEEESGRKRRRLQRDEEEEEEKADRISGLPDHLLHKILASLPTRIAVRTSLLSRRWRTVWTASPDLSFTTRLSPFVVDSVLRLRDPAAPLRSFSLVDGAQLPSWDRTLKYLTIETSTRSITETYAVPPAVFSLPCLRVLELAFPRGKTHIDWPATAFLPSLQRLELADLSLCLPTGDAISRSCPALKYCRLSLYITAPTAELDVSCPLLEVFELTTHVGTAGIVSIRGGSLREVRVRQELARSAPDYLKLSAPVLQTLEWLGPPPLAAAVDATDALVSTLVLRTDNMFITHDLTTMLLNAGRGHTFSALRVNRLILPRCCLTAVLGKLVFDERNEINYSPDQEYENLKHLELTAYFGGFGSLGVAFLLKIFSKIKTLHISLLRRCIENSSQSEAFYNYFAGFGKGEYWDSHNFCLEKLVRISMCDFTGKGYEYDFLEFLFHVATSLRKVTISPDSQATIFFREEIFERMEQLHRSFPYIKIVIS